MSKRYELTVWYEPKGLVCALCGRAPKHGIGIEGDNLDVDVCDDCVAVAVKAFITSLIRRPEKR